ncbi:MAG: DUF2167 domain-containing protein, partial [Gammaproteobacteria bacterium]|nr:DUF2167 domain-containing protein [Gammaproteobacteria bacterium]
MTTLQHGRRRQPLVGLFVLLLLVASPQARAQESSRDPSANDGQSTQLTAEQASYLAWARQLWESLDRRHGAVKLPNGVATLQVPDSFYYLSPADAEKVLVEVWGNPP